MNAIPEEKRHYSIHKGIEKLKTEITLEDYLRRRGAEIRQGRTRCIVHGGDNPQSFSIYDEGRRWHCFACGAGGDLIDLCELVERHADAWTAVVSLSMEFGVKLPERPQSWFEWQDEKGRRRKMARDALTAAYQRRYFRVYSTYLPDIKDDEERKAVARVLWDELWPVARHAAIWRMAE